MRPGNIVVCTNGTGSLVDRLRLAIEVAFRLDWSIQVLTFHSVPPSPGIGPDLIGSGTENEVLRRGWDTDDNALREARALYDRLMGIYGPGGTEREVQRPAPAEWVEVFEPVASSFPSHARACDLIVAGGRSDDPAASTLDDEVSSLALLGSGRLVLFAAHPTQDGPGLLRRLLIAWDDGPAVVRTIAQALPFIARADEVCLLVVGGGTRQPIPVNAILAYLRRHNPNVGVRAVDAPLHSVGHSIVSEARAVGASLIAMGAYEHSRNREVIFGGTTRTVIEHAECAVLMSK